MGFLESAVVIYLRKLYYVNGFAFPLAPMDADIVVVEFWREAATIIMLAAVGVLAGRNKAERFAWFLFSFAVWDIFYYVFLYIFLGWPQSLMTWDILFLIPVPWVGPVITPVIIALTMILFAMSVVTYSERGQNVGLKRVEQLLLLSGSLVAIVSFTRDYMRQNWGAIYSSFTAHNAKVTDFLGYVPAHFDWGIFIVGELLLLVAWWQYMRRMRLVS